MIVPLPLRLEPDSQKIIDDGWNRALMPPGRLGHQDLLDVLVGMQVYQLGVDTFSLRTEKRFAGGTVAMEVAFDRSRPANDRFVVTVHDPDGKVVRSERYSRKEIDDTLRDLFGIGGEGHAPHAPAPPGDREARWERIRLLFPGNPEDHAGGAQKPGPKG